MTSRERFLKACRCEAVDRPPVWLMRQAGRYLPEYRELRAKYDFMTMCTRPDLAVEVSLQPWRRFSMDAVIVFSDILLPAAAMGPKLRVEEGEGPRFEYAIRTERDLNRLVVPHIRRQLAPTLESLAELRCKLQEETALIGFIGSPWTVAAYLVEGGSGDFATILKMKEENPKLLEALIIKLTEVLSAYAVEQVRAGADAIQVFDTWGALLTPADYRRLVVPRIREIIQAVHGVGGTSILFVRQSERLLDDMVESGAHVVSIGSTTDLGATLKRAQGNFAVQGNLDPETLTRPAQIVRDATRAMLESTRGGRGYIANLGHGVLPKTPIESVKAFVETVQLYES